MENIIDLRRKGKKEIIIAFILVFMLIGFYLWDFGVNTRALEQTRGTELLSDLAVQGATIMENRIQATTSTLWAASHFLEREEDFQSQEVMDCLSELVSHENTELVRIGIADVNGNAKRTDGKENNVSRANFFKSALEGKEYISSVVTKSEDSEIESIAVSVPVYSENHSRVKAVLYGIIQTDDFHMYTSTVWDGEEQYIHIIDSKGNYIMHSKNKNSIVDRNNFFDGLTKIHTTVPVEEIQASLENGEDILTQVHKEKDIRYVYIAPLEVNNWSIVTVLKEDTIDKYTNYSWNLVALLVIKVFTTLALFGIFCYWLIMKEKKELEELNKELLIRDRIFKMAVAEIGNFVFTYDVDTGVLEFLNYDGEKLPLPQVIPDFTDNLARYVHEQGPSYKEIKRLLKEVMDGREEAEGEITVNIEDQMVSYRIQLTNVLDSAQHSIQIIGTLKDITEEKQKEIRIRKSEQIRAAVLSDTIGFFEINLSRDCLMKDGEIQESSRTYTESVKQFCEERVSEAYRKEALETFSVRNLMHMYEIGVYDIMLEYLCLDDNGNEFWAECEAHLEEDIVTGDVIALAMVRNINETKMNELKLQKQAVLDSLTKAYNRSAGVEKINTILGSYSDQSNALMLLDLDNFKAINDVLGHLVGDKVLIDVVNILKHHVRSEDVICRIGGDEFVIFLINIPEDAVRRNVTKLLQKLTLTYEKNGVSKELSASIGIAMAPVHGGDFQTLYEKADIALYEVKKESKNNYRIYGER